MRRSIETVETESRGHPYRKSGLPFCYFRSGPHESRQGTPSLWLFRVHEPRLMARASRLLWRTHPTKEND